MGCGQSKALEIDESPLSPGAVVVNVVYCGA